MLPLKSSALGLKEFAERDLSIRAWIQLNAEARIDAPAAAREPKPTSKRKR